MPLKAKAKGNRNENRSKEYLEKKGYKVMRSAASAGEFDLIASDKAVVLFIQCKTGCYPGVAEREGMRAWPVPGNCIKQIHRWDTGKKEPRVLDLCANEAAFRALLEKEREYLRPTKTVRAGKKAAPREPAKVRGAAGAGRGGQRGGAKASGPSGGPRTPTRLTPQNPNRD